MSFVAIDNHVSYHMRVSLEPDLYTPYRQAKCISPSSRFSTFSSLGVPTRRDISHLGTGQEMRYLSSRRERWLCRRHCHMPAILLLFMFNHHPYSPSHSNITISLHSSIISFPARPPLGYQTTHTVMMMIFRPKTLSIGVYLVINTNFPPLQLLSSKSPS